MTELLAPATDTSSASSIFDTIRARVRSHKVQLFLEIETGINLLAERGDWSGAVRLASEEGRLSQADIARGLDVTRSTVMRWVKGETRPPQALISAMARRLAVMLRD